MFVIVSSEFRGACIHRRTREDAVPPGRVGAMAEPAIDDFYAVIPAGGIGSRLWPLSRADAPKFLHDLTGSGQTLLRDTWVRLAPLSGDDRIAVVTGRAHRAAVERELPGVPDHNVFLESEPRDSSAAIGSRRARSSSGASPTSSSVRSPPTTSSVRRGSSISPCGRRWPSPVPDTSARSASTQRALRRLRVHQAGDELIVDGAPEAYIVERFVEKPDLDNRQGVLRGPGLPLERRHVHHPRRRSSSPSSP